MIYFGYFSFAIIHLELKRGRGAGEGGRGAGEGGRVGAVVRALAFHQCVPGSIPGLGVICGLSLLFLYSAPRGFSPGTPVSPLLKYQHLI